MRVTRDRRGYEITSVVAGERRRGGQRLLYFFRTPPGIRVGRAPIDEAAVALLQQHNPDVAFDWPQLLKGTHAQPAAEPPHEGKRSPKARRQNDRPPRSSTVAAVEAPDRRPSAPVPVPAPDELAEPVLTRAETLEPQVKCSAPVPAPPPAPQQAEEPMTPSLERLGLATLARLRTRYQDLAVRLAQQPLDDEVRTELNRDAARLNPDDWRTADEVTAALEQYESIYERLRSVIGRDRRRRPPAGEGILE